MSTMSPGDDPADPCWLGLKWSAWMPLMAAHPLALAQLPAAPGIYRVRRAVPPGELLWVGWAAGEVRETVERLSRQVHLPLEPYDDPTGPALALWRARVRTAAGFQVCGAHLQPDAPEAAEITRALTNFVSHRTTVSCDEYYGKVSS